MAAAVFVVQFSTAPIEDPDELEEAETEVRDLGTFATPEDAQDDLPD